MSSDDASDKQHEAGAPYADDASLPAKGINALIKDNLGSSIRVSNEARDQLHHVCVAFVKHITRQAALASGHGHKKTILYEHVQQALVQCGLSSLLCSADDGSSTDPGLHRVLHQCRERAARRTKRRRSRLEHSGVAESELLRQQQMLIRQAMLQQEADEAAELAQWHEQQGQAAEPDDGAGTPPAAQSSAAPAVPAPTDAADELDEDYDAD